MSAATCPGHGVVAVAPARKDGVNRRCLMRAKAIPMAATPN